MNTNRYIPGDWVKFKDRIAIVKEVTMSDFLLKEYYKDYDPNSEDSDAAYLYSEATLEEIEPIPLTCEILEKNGWNKEEKDGSVLSLSEVFMGGDESDEDSYTCFQLYYQNKKDGWVIDMRGELLKSGVHYVHELQHLFFGLGINSEIKVTEE